MCLRIETRNNRCECHIEFSEKSRQQCSTQCWLAIDWIAQSHPLPNKASSVVKDRLCSPTGGIHILTVAMWNLVRGDEDLQIPREHYAQQEGRFKTLVP